MRFTYLATLAVTTATASSAAIVEQCKLLSDCTSCTPVQGCVWTGYYCQFSQVPLQCPTGSGCANRLAECSGGTGSRECAGSPTYRWSFEGQWSPQTLPQNFPPTARFSPFVIASHDEGYTMSADNTLASAGLQMLAETGGTTAMLNEIVAAGANVSFSVSSPPGLNGLGPADPQEVILKPSHNLVSMSSGIVPSPDWYVFATADMCNHATGVWISSVTRSMYAYDAGTNNGTTYNVGTAAEATSPFAVIERLTGLNSPTSFSGYFPAVPAFGSVRLELQTVTPIADPDAPVPDGSCVRRCGRVGCGRGQQAQQQQQQPFYPQQQQQPFYPQPFYPQPFYPYPPGGYGRRLLDDEAGDTRQMPYFPQPFYPQPFYPQQFQQPYPQQFQQPFYPQQFQQPFYPQQNPGFACPVTEICSCDPQCVNIGDCCDDYEPQCVAGSDTPGNVCSGTPVYDWQFEGTWSGMSFPQNYPQDAHFGPIVIAAHNSAYTMSREGAMATAGLQQLSEDGVPTTLNAEITAANSSVSFTATAQPPNIPAGAVAPVANTFNNGLGLTQRTRVTLDSSHPHISMAAMIAPSPDWYAFATVDMCDPMTRRWVTSIELPMFAYDAGTDDGFTYSLLPDVVTSPQAPITRIAPNNHPRSFSMYGRGVPQFAKVRMQLFQVTP